MPGSPAPTTAPRGASIDREHQRLRDSIAQLDRRLSRRSPVDPVAIVAADAPHHRIGQGWLDTSGMQ